MNRTIACAAGHSGGHIVPCLTLAAQQRTTDLDQCIFFSTASALDAQIIKNNPIATTHVPLHLSTPRRWYQLPGHLLRVIGAFFKSLFHLQRAKPAKIITTGGLVAVPVCLAAWVLRIPIELYELNAVPGKAAQFLAPFATRIFVCFGKAQSNFSQSKCSRFEYPIRYSQSAGNKDEVLGELNFNSTRKTIMILGGSQGSFFINQTIAKQVSQDPELQRNIQIIHQTGASDATDYAAIYRSLGIPAQVFPFSSDLAPYYTAADLVIARAGAGTIFETLFFKARCILIPLETRATDHQVDNARAIAQEYPELFTTIKQDEIEKNSDKLVAVIKHYLH